MQAISFIFFILVTVIFAERREIQLHDKYKLGWDYNLDEKVINFDVEVDTIGYVGFGISPNGGMPGSDVIIGGVDSDGNPYFQDRHATSKALPKVDSSQDWFLEEFDQRDGKTFLKFWRKLDTCDEIEDLQITKDTLRIIFSFGETDDLVHHGGNRGSKSLNMLDAPAPPFDPKDYDDFYITTNMTMPQNTTSYWCTMHAHQFKNYSHVVNFEPILENADARRHAHHFTIYLCVTPEGGDPEELFGRWLDYPGDDCWLRSTTQLPRNLCQPIIYAYAVGGGSLTFPENIGFPLGGEGRKEYFILETHYDNPEATSGITFQSGVRVYYTEQLRPIEAGYIILMTNIDITHTLPPNQEKFMLNGHCAPECTRHFIEPEFQETGINVFNVFLHAHLKGRGLKIRHFRDYNEEPWIIDDKSYDFNYQENRYLQNTVNIKPSDHLVLECTYSTSGLENVTLGGEATTDEMCQSFLWYYPKTKMNYCQSNYQPNYNYSEYFGRFGIEEVAFAELPDSNPTVVKPQSMEGKSFRQVLDEFNWTPEFIEKLQNDVLYGQHMGLCMNMEDISAEPDTILTLTSYPHLINGPYEPETSNECFIATEEPDKPGNSPSFGPIPFLIIFALLIKTQVINSFIEKY